jgi:hypothetical protein
MDYSAFVGEILDQIPTPAAARTARDVLLELALEGDMPAVRTLSAALARRLGFADAEGPIKKLGSFDAVLGDDSIPPLLRIYILGFLPRVFFEETDALVKLASAVRATDDLRGFKRMIRRDDLLQREALKAYYLSVFAPSFGLSTAMTNGPPQVRGAWKRLLRTMLSDCELVEGGDANTKFQVGRELLLQASTDGLFTVLAHEF